MRSRESVWKIHQWVAGLRAELPLGLVIAHVMVRMDELDGDDRYGLALDLTSLLTQAGRHRDALRILDMMIREHSDDVRFPISKATLYLYSLQDPKEALKCIDLALKRAYRTGYFRREALGDKARILLQLGRGEALSKVLEEIMSLKMIKGIPDIGRERDFVDRAPLGLIPEDVVARYNEFRPKRAGDSSADEPPEFEPPDDYD